MIFVRMIQFLMIICVSFRLWDLLAGCVKVVCNDVKTNAACFSVDCTHNHISI